MIKKDEEALICDLAEIYQIYDYKQLPLKQVAIFANGLRNNSRIKMSLNGNEVDGIDIDTLLLAAISDKCSLLLWSKTVDGKKGINRPKMVMDFLLPTTPNQNSINGDITVFSSGEDFEKRRNEILNGRR